MCEVVSFYLKETHLFSFEIFDLVSLSFCYGVCLQSREYKYNRQTFDYKAREMTEKYAKVKADGCSTSLQIKVHKLVILI